MWDFSTAGVSGELFKGLRLELKTDGLDDEFGLWKRLLILALNRGDDGL